MKQPSSSRLTTLFLLAFCVLVLGLAFLPGLISCNDSNGDGEPVESVNGAKPASPPLARVATPALPYEIRRPGETAFSTRSGLCDLPAGTTIRTQGSLIALNVVQAVQVQLFPGSELLLIGWEDRAEGESLVLALQSGEVGIRATPLGCRVVLDTPTAAVSGPAPHFSAKISFDADDLFHLTLQAMSRGITLSNDEGSVALPVRGRAYAGETGPPKLLR